MLDHLHSTPEGPARVPPPAGAGHAAPTGAARAFGLVERAFLVAGLALFAGLLYQLGVRSLLQNLRLVGWGFVVVIAQEIIAVVINTLGWRHAFPPATHRVAFHRLLAARIAGDGINSVTPTATLGGEVVRAQMIAGQIDQTTAWASLAVAKISQTVGQVAFIVLGWLIALHDAPLPDTLRHGLLIAVPGFAALVALTVALQRRGLFTVGVRLMAHLGLPVPVRLGGRLQQIDGEIARFYAAPGRFLLSVGFFFAGWTMGVVEMYLILHFLQVDVSWHRALTIETFSATLEGLLFFVPGKAGTEEGGKVLIFTILDLDPAKGLALGIVRRIRELTWAGIGLAILSRHHLRQRAQ